MKQKDVFELQDFALYVNQLIEDLKPIRNKTLELFCDPGDITAGIKPRFVLKVKELQDE